jgi:hypothetical protein
MLINVACPLVQIDKDCLPLLAVIKNLRASESRRMVGLGLPKITMGQLTTWE